MKAHTPTEAEIRNGRLAALEARDDEIKRLRSINADLLAALQECEAAEDATHDQQADAFRNARAAISKASTP